MQGVVESHHDVMSWSVAFGLWCAPLRHMKRGKMAERTTCRAIHRGSLRSRWIAIADVKLCCK